LPLYDHSNFTIFVSARNLNNYVDLEHRIGMNVTLDVIHSIYVNNINVVRKHPIRPYIAAEPQTAEENFPATATESNISPAKSVMMLLVKTSMTSVSTVLLMSALFMAALAVLLTMLLMTVLLG
jgi:hypothetical protein